MRVLGILAAFALLLAGAWWLHARRGPLSPAPEKSGEAAVDVAAPRPPAEPLSPPGEPGSLEPLHGEDVQAPSSIRGTVTDEHGTPLHDGLSVVALDAAGEIVTRASVDASGAFTLGAVGFPAVRIEPRKDGWFARESPEITGLGGEVRLVLERGGRMEGSLLLDPARGSLGAHVRATREDDATRWRFGEIHDDGTFEIEGLDSGDHVFELVGDGQGMAVGALSRIGGVRVRRSETTRDPRLQGVPLHSFVRAVQLVVEDGGGTPLEGATVHVLERQGGVLGRMTMTRDSLHVTVPQDRLVDGLIVHEGFRPVLVTLGRPLVRVVLAPGIRVFLRPTRPTQLDRGSVGAFLRLRPELAEIETWPVGVCDVELPLSLGSEPVTEVVFPFPGHYRLYVTVVERMGTRFGFDLDSRPVPLEESFDVLASDAGRRRDIWLPPDLFEQAGRAAQPR